MTDNNDDKNPPRATPVPQTGRFIVDIRIFMLSMTIAMCASFFAGVTMGPAGTPGSASSLTSVFLAPQQQQHQKAASVSQPPPPPALDLSADVIAESLKHSPSGQHLLVDIANVQPEFLNSEDQLTNAMLQTIKETGLTLLSYHCHKLSPAGISCVGVILESHISFHTWPDEGVITLDLFTCGPKPLLPHAVETIERSFGIPRTEDDKVRVKWSHELRGFRPEEQKSNNVIDGYSDLSTMVLSPLDVYSKKQIYSNLTKFQRVDIWEVVELDDYPSHADSLKHNLQEGDPRWETPELVTPDNSLFLNGYLQRDASLDIETHEALTHPGMFAHPNPQNVAIIGGREGGVLREVLKHNTVQSATLVEVDEELVKIARQYMPQMSNCSDLIGRAENCFDDELVNLVYEDPRDYFKKHYGKTRASSDTAPLMDVIIMDEKDPRQAPELYTDQAFVSSVVKALSPEGVLVIHAGMAPDISDANPDEGVDFVRGQLIHHLETNPEVQAILVYEEPRTGYDEPTALLVVCKHVSCRSRWYARSDQIDYAIYERIIGTHSKERAVSYYDGTTQFSYQWTPKAWETVYCRREPTPFECAYIHLDPKKALFDLDLEDEDKSAFRIETTTKMVISEDGEEEEVSESSVFAKVDIPAGSYVMPKHLASSLVVTERNLQGLQKNVNVGGGPVSVIEDLLEFIDEYGHKSHTEGTDVHFVEIGGSVLIREVDNPEEANLGRWVPPHPSGRNPVFSPVYERHRMSFDVFIVATKDISDGAELLRYSGLWEH
jgi:S-adenosylmethionine decarboxylase proenzyme